MRKSSTEQLIERLEAIGQSPEEQTQLDPAPPDGGYFSRVHCDFADGDSIINSQYAKLFKRLGNVYDPSVPLSENAVLRRAFRLVSAHKILMSTKVPEIYHVVTDSTRLSIWDSCAFGPSPPSLSPSTLIFTRASATPSPCSLSPLKTRTARRRPRRYRSRKHCGGRTQSCWKSTSYGKS